MTIRGQHRHISLRHERHLLRGTAPALAPGEVKISSFYLPSLGAGEYTFTIDQSIQAPNEKTPKDAQPAKRKIEVLAPEWALSAASNGDSETTNASDEEAAVVLSVFPASGQTAPSFKTLPQMVLRDAQLPWIRSVSKRNTDDNNSIPWFALITFTADELELDADARKAYFEKSGATVNDTLGWDITVDRLKDIEASELANFIPSPLDPDLLAKTKTSLIPVPVATFQKLFPPIPPETTFDVSPYRFMCHVRTVPTQGTLSAGIAADKDHDPNLAGTQTLSVIVSHRLGPTNVNVPTPVLTHLVSLQGISGTETSVLNKKKHVLMTSLFSWTYTALPPDAPDVVSMLQHLGTKEKGLTVLRTDMTDDSQTQQTYSVEQLITKRQNDGFNLVRHRVITGEQTSAMYRGPLTPTKVLHPLNKEVSFQSNFGTDLQILDPNLGLMDISYASAWQLGKTLGMSDPAFTAALSRLRSLVHKEALEKARQKNVKAQRGANVWSDASSDTEPSLSVFSDQNPHVNYMPKNEIKSDLSGIVASLNGINQTVHEVGTAFSTNRWRRRSQMTTTSSDRSDSYKMTGTMSLQDDLLSLRSAHVYPQMAEHAHFHMLDNANTPEEKGPYNYHTIPSNTDYAVIQEWVLNKLHLSGIPVHYYLPDPSYVPEETLRFFHIDRNWTDALIDGALSLANHMASSPEEDYCRSALKEALNRYLKTPIVGSYCQQLPSYGFILRSKLLVQFPDLAVTAEFNKSAVKPTEDWDKAKPSAPILIQRRLGPDMMLVLMDREPPHLTAVTFTLPAHQQTFEAAFNLKPDTIEIQCKRIYATGADAALPELDPETRRSWFPPPENPYPTNKVFDWDVRTLKIEPYINMIHCNLKAKLGAQYESKGPTSAVFSLQLNEPIYRLTVTAEKPKVKVASTGEELDSWEIPDEPKSFQFYPPAFPTDKFRLVKPVETAVNWKIPTYEPTRLQPTEAQLGGSNTSFTVVANNAMSEEFIATEKLAVHRKTPIPPRLGHPIYPTDYPAFSFGVFPIGRQDDDYIPCNSGRSIDLVFSIVRLARPEDWQMRFLGWEVLIQIGHPQHGRKPNRGDYTTPRALLRTDMPAGPPPVMLSNLRYNVLVQKWDETDGLLYLSIVPRSKWGVHLRETPDASFLLPMANIYPWDIPGDNKYPVEITYTSRMISQNNVGEKERKFVYKVPYNLKKI